MNVEYRTQPCLTYRKKKHRYYDQDSESNDCRAFLKCLDEDGNILHRSSACPEGKVCILDYYRKSILYFFKLKKNVA